MLNTSVIIKFLNSKRKAAGSITVDAAVSLCVFILTFTLLFSLFGEIAQEAKLYERLSKEADAGLTVLGALNADLPFMVAVGSTEGYGISRSLYYRPFAGESELIRTSGNTVYVYLKSGTRYHYAGCSTMDRNPNFTAMSKSTAEAKGYTSCKLCGKGGIDYFKKRISPLSSYPSY